MTVIVPTVELNGSGALVEWVGLTPGDDGQAVDVSAFKSFMKRVVSSGDLNGLILEAAMRSTGPWLATGQSLFDAVSGNEGWWRPRVAGGTSNTFTVTILCRT